MGLESVNFKGDLDVLFNAILELENIDECYKFFEDIATISELRAISQRIQVAKMLRDKKIYTEISEVTGASTATISRVNKSLNYGRDGYNIVLNRLLDQDNKNSCKKSE